MPAPFKPRKFFDVAREIVRGGPSEARHRLAVGRAYYACFLVAREWAHITDRDQIHAAVIETLHQHHPALGDTLATLRMYRVVADYQMTPEKRQYQDWGQNWKYVQILAEDLLEKLDRIEPLRSKRE